MTNLRDLLLWAQRRILIVKWLSARVQESKKIFLENDEKQKF